MSIELACFILFYATVCAYFFWEDEHGEGNEYLARTVLAAGKTSIGVMAVVCLGLVTYAGYTVYDVLGE